MIGVKFDDEIVESFIDLFPFEVIRSPNNDPAIKILNKTTNETKYYQCKDILTLFLKYIKQLASNHLHFNVKNCVISIPTTYTSAQRQV